MSKSKPITEGRMQIKLEAALENIGALSYDLRQIEAALGEDITKMARYHLKGIEDYITEVSRAMQERWGSTEGQLCPYKDCLHDLAFRQSGWWRCPNCNRDFYAESADGIEDFHCYPTGHSRADALPDKYPIRFARDLGPSYATPKEAPDAEAD